MKEEPLSVTGRYSVKTNSSGEIAKVIFDGRTIRTLTGETAWSDAVRIAEDLNLEDKRKERNA